MRNVRERGASGRFEKADSAKAQEEWKARLKKMKVTMDAGARRDFIVYEHRSKKDWNWDRDRDTPIVPTGEDACGGAPVVDNRHAGHGHCGVCGFCFTAGFTSAIHKHVQPSKDIQTLIYEEMLDQDEKTRLMNHRATTAYTSPLHSITSTEV